MSPQVDDSSQQPLLSGQPVDEEDVSETLEHKAPDAAALTLSGELRIQASLAAPLILSNFLQFMVNIVSVMIVGHLGPEALASAALGTSFSNVSLLSVLIGVSFALDTLCTQAYGAGNFVDMAYGCQRTFLVQVVIAVPLVLLNWNVESVLLFAGQDPAISAGAGPYTRLLIPSVLIQGATTVVQRYLQAQGITKPAMWASMVALVFHVGACKYAVAEMGYTGAPAAMAVTNLFVLIWVLIAAASSPCAKHFPGWTWECFSGWGPVLMLALPSLGMLSIEWWTFEAQILLAGRLQDAADVVGASVVCFSTITVAFSMPYGLSAAAATRVGNELGAGRPKFARRATVAAAILGFSIAACTSTLAFAGRKQVALMFVGDGEDSATERSLVIATLPIVSLVLLCDGVQGTLSGVLRGVGNQATGTALNAVAYLVIGLPLSYYLGITRGYGLHGLWKGQLAAVATQATSLVILLLGFTNWKKASESALERSKSAVNLTGLEADDENEIIVVED